MLEFDATKCGGDAAYHLRRVAQERAAAAAAVDLSVRRIHLRLADHHAARACDYSLSPSVATIEDATSFQPTPHGRVIASIAGETDW